MIARDQDIIISKPGKYSTYHYYKREINKPEQFKDLKRKYNRFGIGTEVLEKLLLQLEKPKVVLITSIMT